MYNVNLARKGSRNGGWLGGRKVKKHCKECGKEFEYFISQNRIYCSSNCRAKDKGLRSESRGDKHWNWKGGVTPLRVKMYFSDEYKLWRTAVFERDNYICIWCGQRGGKLNADHIKPWGLFPELRFAIDNGRTLCEDCHRRTDTWGWNTYHLIKNNDKNKRS